MSKPIGFADNLLLRRSRGHSAVCEPLEPRRLLAATIPTISVAPFGDGTQLRILGTASADTIAVRQDGDTFTIDNHDGWSQTETGPFKSLYIAGGAGPDRILLDPSVTVDALLYGGGGRDTLVGGSGNDQLLGQGAVDRLRGGGGNDTLDAIGGSNHDRLRGDAGNDSFYADPTDRVADLQPDESLHSSPPAASTASDAPPENPTATELPEPQLNNASLTYSSFTQDPLFSAAGPLPDDVRQGFVGDCFFLAVLSSIARTDPAFLTHVIQPVGDGTYIVTFMRNGKPDPIHIDADLPVWSWGQPAYAALGADSSLWVALLEKAYALFRTPDASYASLDGGWMAEVYSALGVTPTATFSVASPQALLQLVKTELADHRSITWATNPTTNDPSVVSAHAYSVDAVVTDSTGTPTAIRLRNPWGIDGAGNDGVDDGYIILTASQAYASFWGLVWATV